MTENQKLDEAKQVNNFLSKIKEITNSETQDSLESFNVFSLCRVGQKEIIHSAILATLLDPRGGHGLGTMPLENFLKQLDFNYETLTDASVKTEETILSGQRRLDILIESRDFCIIVENKTTTVDHEGQLDAYAKWLEKNIAKDNKRLFYLTYKGDPATNAKPDIYTQISYKEHIVQWLKNCIDCINDTKLKNIFEQYCNFLEILTSEENMEINEKLAKEIIENFDVAQNIAKNINKAKAYWLWTNIITPLKEKGFHADRDLEKMYKTDDICFWYKKDNIKIQYAFDNYGFKNPRREIIVFDESGKEETKKTCKTSIPFDLNDKIPDAPSSVVEKINDDAISYWNDAKNKKN